MKIDFAQMSEAGPRKENQDSVVVDSDEKGAFLFVVADGLGGHKGGKEASNIAAEMLKEDFGVTSDIWSATSFNELARDGQDAARHNRLNPLADKQVPYVTTMLNKATGPVIAATDYMKNYAEQIRAFVPNDYTVLGTDGFGRSDSRVNLRRFFEVDANHIAAAAMTSLFEAGAITKADMQSALTKYDIDGDKPNPRLV